MFEGLNLLDVCQVHLTMHCTYMYMHVALKAKPQCYNKLLVDTTFVALVRV